VAKKRQSIAHRLETIGTPAERIPVELSYQIIHHFSAGLYTSPNKAIEELVSNSYDAFATHVDVMLPENLSAKEATVWVVDNGQAMDIAGFHDLWLIGESRKRDAESSERPPIGKFGIGKLATYVLAKHLTYICKRSGKYFAISMDFSKLEDAPQQRKHLLVARTLTSKEAKEGLQPLLSSYGENTPPITLFGAGSAKTWTAAAMTDLTEMGRNITQGRLHRVLRTALPINPQFNLHMNGEVVEPEKITKELLRSWKIGEGDKVAEELDYKTTKINKNLPAVLIPQLGPIYGEVQLFRDALQFGKSEDWGRSHGFFVMVRGRLINLHDELFGLEALSHGAFQRFRMVVHAAGLDAHLRATRESVSAEARGVREFREYLRAKFNEARAFYGSWLVDKEKEESVSQHVQRTPRSLSRQPLLAALKRVLTGEIAELRSVRIPAGLDEAARLALLSELEKQVNSDSFFQDVRFEPIGLEHGIAIFDASDRCFKVNILHPFYSNYAEHYQSSEPYELIAVSEVLTEAYLLEEGLTVVQTSNILERRDRFLRELVFSTQLAAPLVAQLLNNAKAHSSGFEGAVFEGMRSLGFEVTKLGGKGKPDGIALARMGIREGEKGSAVYKVAYDAKSTGGDRVSAKDLNIAGIVKHRTEHGADFSLIVAPGYDGDGNEESDAVKHAKGHGVTLMTLDDFVTLVLVAASKPLGFRRLRDELFASCRGPIEAAVWIQALTKEKTEDVPLNEILDVIWEMMTDSPDPPKFASVRERLAHKDARFKHLSEQRIREWIESIRRLERDLITIMDDKVYLENPPASIMKRLSSQTRRLKRIDLKESIYKSLIAGETRSAARAPKRKKTVRRS
jgi:hypothetical protein